MSFWIIIKRKIFIIGSLTQFFKKETLKNCVFIFDLKFHDFKLRKKEVRFVTNDFYFFINRSYLCKGLKNILQHDTITVNGNVISELI